MSSHNPPSDADYEGSPLDICGLPESPAEKERRKAEEERRHRSFERTIAFWGFVVAAGVLLATICLGIWQAGINQRAINESSRNAAQTLKDSQETRLLDERAWLSVKDAPTLVVKIGQPIMARVPLVNTGRTPAMKVRTQVFFMDPPATAPNTTIMQVFDAARQQKPFLDDGVVPPNGGRTTEVHSEQPLTEAERAEIHQGSKFLYLSEVIKYEDIYGHLHTTKACFHVMSAPTDPDSVRGLLAYCPDHNDMN